MLDDARDRAFPGGRERRPTQSRQRAIYLAGLPDVGIPPDGSAYILRRDPLTQGRAVLERRCLGCHVFDGKGSGTQTASDLASFGSRAWVRGLLENPRSPTYFGKVAKFDGMAEWKKSSKLKRQAARRRGRFRRLVRRDPRRHDPRRWLNSPGVSDHPGLAPFQKECGKCHVIDGLDRRGDARRPQALRLGLASLDRPHDPQAAIVG